MNRCHRTPPQLVAAMKERAIGAAAHLRGMASGLTETQCAALSRFARDQFRRKGHSPARAVSLAASLCRDMAKEATR